MAMPESDETSWRKLAVSDGIPKRSFYVAVLVGTILNLINQGDAIISGGDLQYGKMALTFVVPYVVATYGAVSARRARVFEARGGD